MANIMFQYMLADRHRGVWEEGDDTGNQNKSPAITQKCFLRIVNGGCFKQRGPP